MSEILNSQISISFLFIDLTVGADETTAIYPGIWLVQILVFWSLQATNVENILNGHLKQSVHSNPGSLLESHYRFL